MANAKAQELKQQVSESKIAKPNAKHAAMGVGERTKKGEPAPGQGAAPGVEIGEPSEPGDMSPEQKEQLEGGDDATLTGHAMGHGARINNSNSSNSSNTKQSKL